MRKNQQLPDLLGDIYDTALNPTLWPQVLAEMMDFVGSRTCGLIMKDPASGLGEFKYHANVDPHFVQIYRDIYVGEDTLTTFITSNPSRQPPAIGQVASMPELLNYDDFRRQCFFQEWLRPQDRADTAYVVLEKSKTNVSFLALAPGQANGMVDDEMRRRLTFIAPHARRALLVGKAMELKQAEAATAADALDNLSAAMFLVDACGRIVHANATGQDMLYANDFLYSLDGRLAVRDPLLDRTLREGCAAAAGESARGDRSIALPMTAHDGERYLAHVLPLTSGARRTFGVTYGATAAVFVRKVAVGSAPHVIAQTYQLTPAELRVLTAIVEIGGVPETAEALGVAETTVKTHLSRLFDKTGASRQADLVKLVVGFSNPLVG